MSIELPLWMEEVLSQELPLLDVKEFSLYSGAVKIYFDNTDNKHEYFRWAEDGTRVVLDGVTTALKCVPKPFLVPWASKLCMETIRGRLIGEDGSLASYSTEQLYGWLEEAKNKHKERLEEAGSIGKMAHQCLEDSIKHAIRHTGGVVRTLINLPEHPESVNCVHAAHDWMVRHKVIWLKTERLVYSRKYDFPGTMDGLCYVSSCDDINCCRGKVFSHLLGILDFKTSRFLSDEYAYQTAGYLLAFVEEMNEDVQHRFILRLGKQGGFESWYCPPEHLAGDIQAFLSCLSLHRSLKEIKARRKADDDELKAILKAARAAEKKEVGDRVKEEKRALREAAKAQYKALRAAGMSVVEAKATVYPKGEPDVPSA